MREKKLLLLCCMTLFMPFSGLSNAAGQGVNTKYEKVIKSQPLTDVLKQLEKTYGVKIIFSYEDLQSYRVTAQVKADNVRDALSQIIGSIPVTYSVSGNYINVKTTADASAKMPEANQVLVKGQVVDSEGDAIVGATIKVEGGNANKTYAVTDINGEFSLTLPKGKGVNLVASFLGMKDAKHFVACHNNASNLVIRMDDNSRNIDEVVVTGYQTISKERATGSFDKVSEKMLESRPTADISSALQGLVAGMQGKENADGSVDFTIRGTSTLLANTQPLVVVDGFPIEGTFNSINPNDVESVTVLKDAAAASIWGTRSANGVIVVTTKRGKTKKLQVEGKAFWRIGTNPDIEYITTQADSRTTVDYEMRALENGWDMGYAYSPGFSYLYYNPLSLATELYYKNKYYGLSDEEMNAGLEKLRNTSNRKQLKKYLMQTALLQQYNANISGGTDKMDNYMSLMYEKNAESTIRRGYERFMLNYNTQYKFNKIVTASVAATLQKRKQNTSGVTVSEFSELSPYELLVNEDGSYAPNLNTWNRFELENVAQNLPYSDLSYNLLQEVRNRQYITDYTKYRIQMGLNFKLFKGLTYDMKLQYERNESSYKGYDNESTFKVRSTVDYYTHYDSDANQLLASYLPKGGIINSNRSENHNTIFRNQLSYSNVFGKHDITTLAGMEASAYVTNTTTDPTVYGYNEVTNTASSPLYGSRDDVYDIMGYTENYPGGATTYSDREDRYLSYFANAAYMYDGLYGASFSVRSDGSNFVSKDKSLRWAPMWSAGVKWNMHNEKFMANAKWVDRLTLRATYGLNGNAEKSTSPQTLISSYYNGTLNSTMAYVASYGNPRLKWETTHTTDVGVDFSFFGNMLSGKIDYYSRYSKDVIGDVTIPAVYGSTTQRINNAEISNRGVELELTGRFNVKPIDLGIQSTVTFAYNKNKIEKLYNPSLYCYDLVESTTFVEGKPIGSIYSYKFAGTEDGIPYVYGANGEKASMNDLTLHNRTLGLDIMEYSGTTVSPYTFGWVNQFNWKGLELYVFITGKFGGVFRAPTTTFPVLSGDKPFVSKYISDFANSDGTLIPTWPNKDEFYMYRWDRYIPNLSYFVEDASFIRLKEIDLSYNLPDFLIRKVGLKGVKLFVQARDLGMLYTANKYGYDPEWLPGSNKPAASFTFGANINF